MCVCVNCCNPEQCLISASSGVAQFLNERFVVSVIPPASAFISVCVLLDHPAEEAF